MIKLSQLLFNPINKDSMRLCVIETKFMPESYFVISSAVRNKLTSEYGMVRLRVLNKSP